MTNPHPFSLRIFIADGDPDGLRVVERSNWVGKALMFPRSLLPKVRQRTELDQTGVYLLLGPREDGEGDMLYVGEGDPVAPRLQDHQVKKGFNMLGMLPVLGVHAFEQPARQVAAPVAQLTCKGKGVVATGYEGTQGFVVRAGSQAVAESVPSMQQHVRGMYDIRRELIANGVLARDGEAYRFSQDYAFTSPSTAAAVVLGRSANGRIEWKDAKGQTLKDLQALEAQV